MAKRVKKLTTEIREVTNPDRWDRSHGTYIAGRAFVDGADAVAVEMERYWGVDRLRLLVTPEVREKFDRQRYLFNAAISNGDLESVRRESTRMIAGWMACNKIALAAGHTRMPPEVWEVALGDGTVAWITKTAVGAKQVLAEGRQITVYSLEEVGHILSAHSLVNKVKATWPGAQVVAAKQVVDPLRAIDRPTGFDEPFNDEIKIAR